MDFRQRAHTALERDEPGRALMILVRGLRQHPERDDALDFFLFIYVDHIHQPGFEAELLRGLEFHPDRGVLLRLVIDKLRQAGKGQMARHLAEEAEQKDIAIAAAPAVVEEKRPVERDVSVTGDSDDGDGESAPVPQNGNTGEYSGEPDVEPEIGPDDDSVVSHPEKDLPPEGETTPHGPSTIESERRRTEEPKKRWIFALAVAATAGVLAIGIGLFGWQHARDVQRMWAVDDAMVTLDPTAAHEVRQVLDEYGRSGRDVRIGERRWFVDALEALEQGKRFDGGQSSTDPDTPWGLAAAALEAASHRDWERAMRFVRHLERSHRDELPAVFVRGRLCEVRRQWDCAFRRYRRVQERFEEFLPAHIGAMRVSAHQYDRDSWREHREMLGALRADHAYARLAWLTPFAAGSGDNSETIGDGEPVGDDLFLRQWKSKERAIAGLQRGRWTEVLDGCEARECDGPCQLSTYDVVCARAAAGGGDATASWKYFRAAAEDSGLAEEFYRQVQTTAPGLLSDLGRAQWALALTIPHDDEVVGQDESDQMSELIGKWENERPDHFRPPDDEVDDRSAEAILVRGQTLVSLGATRRARRALAVPMSRPATSDRAHFEVAWAYLVEGRRQSARRAIAQIGDERLQQGAEAYLAYLEGRNEEAYQLGWENGDDPRLLRVRILAYMADGRGRDAMSALEGTGEDLATLSLLSVQRRVLARTGARESGERLGEPMESADVGHSIDHLVDRAAAAFWQRDLDTSSALLAGVLGVVEDHPEANWKMGLVRRVEGDEAGARGHFRRAWRGDEDSTYLLVASGWVHLEYGRWEQAREVFLRAVLRDREQVEAVDGLGRAYYEGDRARGRRDLVQLLENYRGTAAERPARAEMMRWVAIVHGSRQGEDGALHYLEKARRVGGERVSTLVEMGRFYAARGEWGPAREHYGKALRTNPTVPEVHFRLAEVAEAQGDVETARDHLARFWRLTPVGDLRREAKALETKLAGGQE